MDDRKKRINELEKQKKEQLILLDTLLARFGESLFSRTDGFSPENTPAFEELADYRRFLQEIAGAETAIQVVEEQLRRFKELENSIGEKEQEEGACSKELSLLHGSLGKLLLDVSELPDNSVYAEFCAPYRDQARALLTKVRSLEERLGGLGQSEGGNVFTWIGKNAQGLVLRSFLTKAQENLEQLHRNIGERYSRGDTGALPDATSPESGASAASDFAGETAQIVSLCAEIEHKRADSRALAQDLEDLRGEKQQISDSFSADGGPYKQIQTLKSIITQVQDALKTLYRHVGSEAAAVISPNTTPQRRQLFDSLIKLEDQELMERALGIDGSVRETDAAMEKIRASLAIDDEKAKIEKYRRMIQDRKDKIAQAEKNIAEYETGIRNSEANIEKLEKLL